MRFTTAYITKDNALWQESTQTVYDLRGNVIRQYGATYPVWYQYDAEGRMVAMATTRDAALDPATVDTLDHPSLDVTRWLYDPATGLLVQKLYDDGKGPSYTYTPDGKLATRTWARGVVTEYGYDVAGELASVQYSDGTLPILKTYNRMGHPVSIISAGTTNTFEYSATTLEKISDTQLGYAIRRGYDNLGRMETLSITNLYDGSYAYDVFGRFATSSFEGLDFHYAYLPGADLVNRLTYGAVKKTVAFEAQRNLVTGIAYHTIADALIAERTYTYNALGNVVARTRQRGADPVETDDFDHNLRSELIAASLGGTNAVSGTYGYAYDSIGNCLAASNRSDVITYVANALNQYTNIVAEAVFIPEFDDDGNQTLVKTSTGIWHVTYNAENRPVIWSNETAVVTMDFDRMGRRVWYKSISGAQTNAYAKFVYDGYLCVQKLDGTTGNIEQEYVWDPTETVATRPLKWTLPGLGRTFLYFHDGNKNISELIDADSATLAAHYDYAPFGAVTVATGSMAEANPYRFSSEYHDDALGCVYYNFRHYNPYDGRWMTRDPMGNLFRLKTPLSDRISSQIRSFLSGPNNSKIARAAIWVLGLEETLKNIEIDQERKAPEIYGYSFIENRLGMSNDYLGLHTAEDCDADYEQDAEECRSKKSAAARAVCWAGAAAKYAACLASSEQALKCYCVAAAVAVSQLDSPAPGPADAAACAILTAAGVSLE